MPEAIIADAGFEHQMHCRSELAMLCTRAMYGACFDTSHSLTMVRTRCTSAPELCFPVFLPHEQLCLFSGQLTLAWAAMVGVPCRRWFGLQASWLAKGWGDGDG